MQRGLYAIVDLTVADSRGIEPLAALCAILEAPVAAVQLRAKHASAERVLQLLRQMAPVAERANVPLFANDRADLALLSGVAGLHVGQDDLRPASARRLIEREGFLVGISTHDEQQAQAAATDPHIDYLALGPVFATKTKERHDPVLGVERARGVARSVKQLRPTLPVCAIGGITEQSIGQLAGDFDLVAIASQLFSAGGSSQAISSVARNLAAAFEAGR